jgi:hypothetical protein
MDRRAVREGERVSTKKAPGVAPTTTEGQSRGSANCPPNESHPSSKEKNMTNSTPRPFRPTDRFELAAHGDRYDGLQGVVRSVFVNPASRVEHAHVTLDDGTITTFPTARLRHLDALPELPQRIRGATLVPLYIDAEPPRHGWSEKDPHVCKHSEPHDGPHECERCTDAWLGAGPQWRCTVDGCTYSTWVSDEALAENPDALEESKRAHQADHEAHPGAESVDVATYQSTAGHVIVYRLFAGEIHTDLLTDARIDKPEHLRELSAVLLAAAKAWEAAQ